MLRKIDPDVRNLICLIVSLPLVFIAVIVVFNVLGTRP
jgi:hypothetical protein